MIPGIHSKESSFFLFVSSVQLYKLLLSSKVRYLGDGKSLETIRYALALARKKYVSTDRSVTIHKSINKKF